MEAISQNDPNDIKRRYFNKLRKIYQTYGDQIVHKKWNELLLQENITSIKFYAFKNSNLIFEVFQENDKDILILKQRSHNDSIIKVLSAEECFPIILKAHEESMHGDGETITDITKHFCVYPDFCIALLLQCCNVCKEPSTFYSVEECKQIQSTKAIWKFLIHKMDKCKKFNYFFIYMEVVTKYVVIRPLMKFSIEELGMELMRIFSTFGPPKKILTSRDHEDFLFKTLSKLAVINPDYLIPIGKCNDYLFDISSVVEAFKQWLKNSGSKDWEIGCHIVQWKFNTSLRVIKQKNNGREIVAGVPYNLFFGNKANTFNHISGDLVADQINLMSRDQIILEIYPHTNSTKIVDKILNIGSDGRDNESVNDIVRCCVCNEEFTIYTCVTCKQPLHYKCGTRIQSMVHSNVNKNVNIKLVCAICTTKEELIT